MVHTVSVCLSVCVSQLSTAVATCGGFAAVGPAAGTIGRLLHGAAPSGQHLRPNHGIFYNMFILCAVIGDPISIPTTDHGLKRRGLTQGCALSDIGILLSISGTKSPQYANFGGRE